MNEILRLVGACLIAFLLGAVTALSIGAFPGLGMFGSGSGAAVSIDELRAAHRQSQAIAEIAERENRELTGEIQELRNRLERSLAESRELREQISGIATDNQSAQDSARGLEETNRRFRGLIEEIEAQAD